MKRPSAAAAAAALLLLAAAPAALAQAQPEPAAASADALFHATTLSLSASGETKTKPDMATISLGVVSRAATAAEAMQADAADMQRVSEALRRGGVAEKDIQTSGLNLAAQYVYHDNQPPQLTGYQASNQVTVRVRDLARLGPIVDATVGAGANQINGISFGLADPTAAENAARQDAVRALQAKADLYARATGYRVLRLVSLAEGAPEAPIRPMAMSEVVVTGFRKAATPVAPGEMTVRIEVTGLYELTR